MIHKKILNYLLLTILPLLIFIPSYQVLAAEEGAGFNVQAVLPESQLDSGNTYFDLNLQPGKKETLGIDLINSSDREMNIQISAQSAFTNRSGFVEYGKIAESYDPSLKYFMDDLIETPEVVTLKPHEKKTVDLTLTMPAESFKGILAGGIRIAEVDEKEKDDSNSGEGVAVKNTFSYVIGVVLSNKRDVIVPELELADVYPDQLNSRNIVTALIQNMYPTFVNQVEAKAKIKREGDEEIFAETQKVGMQIAPNSDFSFPIELSEGKPFQSGKYTVDMTVKSGEQEWHWIKEFTITAEVAKKLNEQDVYVENSIDWKMIGLISCVFLLLIVVIYLSYRNYQQTRDSKNEEE